VGDDYPCCGTTLDSIQLQWRTYGWNGARFAQVAGPTAFGVDTRFPNLALNPTTITPSAPDAGLRYGVLTLSITAHGTVTASQMSLNIGLADAGLTPEGTGWTGFTTGGHSVWEGRRPAPAPGHSVTLQLGVTRPVSRDTLTGKVWVRLWPTDKNGGLTKDGWNRDNSLNVEVVHSQ